ncbi:hypothetical protein AaE_008695 [Aphanomyces astaci]|uniref:PiggyBac transposable element-derived protein domain-containing protein n=1 Tax=Aphanomyces astaci TaxID=112090 RepID=A0A6A5A6Z1_APHAT|nr:hypothetical protein AaE_008695 [Aphanomyces astaci]
MQNRLGWCKALDNGSKQRPAHVAKGHFRMAQSKTNPQMVAIGWVDTKPVYFLASGLSTEPTHVGRRDKVSSEKAATPAFECIQCVLLTSTYLSGMNGCDRHDQLRLHSYSVQRFIDMAIVNAYIVHKEVAERLGERPFSHRKFIVVWPSLGSQQLTLEAQAPRIKYVSNPQPS